jgi:K+-transporting ATPase ATPase A chain
MSSLVAGLLQVGVLLLLLGAVYVPFGNFMARVFSTERHWRVERVFYRLVRVDPDTEQRWTVYGAGILGLSFVSVLLLYVLQRVQPTAVAVGLRSRCGR